VTAVVGFIYVNELISRKEIVNVQFHEKYKYIIMFILKICLYEIDTWKPKLQE